MTTMLIVFVLLSDNTLGVLRDKEMVSPEECISAALIINQNKETQYNAACYPLLKKHI
jgi:hypothetical protein|tara:strand:+ start:717 stop:890 length:174 start_codon:yes stop_codon:yes gene_type:complete